MNQIAPVTQSKSGPQDLPAAGRPHGGGRSLLHLVIQCCTVELFHSLGVALAPLEPERVSLPTVACELTGTIPFAGDASKGLLTLALEAGVYGLVPSAARQESKHDALRELTNQLGGRIKNRLLKFRIPLRFGLPSTMLTLDAEKRHLQVPDALRCAFRTLRGIVFVTLRGVDEASLDFSSAVQVASEGDFILF